MKALKLILLTLTCLLFTVGSRPANTPKDNLVATASRLQDKVEDLKLEMKTLIYKAKKEMVKANTLIEDMDKVIRKIDSHEITYWNDEITDIDRRINDLYDKSNEIITHKVEDLRHRYVAINCELDANPRLKRLVYVDDLQKIIDKWGSLMDEQNSQANIYNDMVNDFNSKTDKLPKR